MKTLKLGILCLYVHKPGRDYTRCSVGTQYLQLYFQLSYKIHGNFIP